MYYENYYCGMHFGWWFIWAVMLLWIFATPYDIPGQRKKRDRPLDILQKRFASGLISNDEYAQKRKLLENNLSKLS